MSPTGGRASCRFRSVCTLAGSRGRLRAAQPALDGRAIVMRGLRQGAGLPEWGEVVADGQVLGDQPCVVEGRTWMWRVAGGGARTGHRPRSPGGHFTLQGKWRTSVPTESNQFSVIGLSCDATG